MQSHPGFAAPAGSAAERRRHEGGGCWLWGCPALGGGAWLLPRRNERGLGLMTVAKIERRRSWWLPAGAASPGTRAEMLLRLSLWEGGGTELYFGLSVARASARRLRCERRLLGAGLGSARGSGTFPAPAESQGTRGGSALPKRRVWTDFQGASKKKKASPSSQAALPNFGDCCKLWSSTEGSCVCLKQN